MEARKITVILLTVLAFAALLMAFEWLADQSVPELKEHVVHYVDRQITG